MSKPHLSGITRGSVGFLGGRDLPSLHAALKQSDQKVDTTLASHLSPCLCSTYPPFPVRAGWLPNLRVWKETQSKKKWCLIVSLCLIVSVCMEIRREWEHISIKMHRSCSGRHHHYRHIQIKPWVGGWERKFACIYRPHTPWPTARNAL